MKRILLAVCGLTPQVVTETLYALQMDGRLPHAIRILTTREGKGMVNSALLAPGGALDRFCSDYGIDRDSLDLGFHSVRVVCDESGTEYDDIDGEEANERFLALCMNEAFHATQDPGAQVLFSIAGGRKTMGACLAIAAQCYGRPQDRLYHVLVSPEFESSRDFFYPPPVPVPIQLFDHKSRTPFIKETRYASVTLVPLPFFSIRDRLTPAHLRQPESPASLMLSVVRERNPNLVIDTVSRKLVWKGKELDLKPAWMALYLFFALRKKNASCGSTRCSGCGECTCTLVEIMEQSGNIAELYRQHLARYRDHGAMSDTGIQSLNQENFNSYRNKINRAIEGAFGPLHARSIRIDSTGRRPGVRYGIQLSREKMQVII